MRPGERPRVGQGAAPIAAARRPGRPTRRGRGGPGLGGMVLVALLAAWTAGCEPPDGPIPILDGPIVRSSTEDGALRVVGVVTNIGTLPADHLRVAVRVEDASGAELARASAWVEASPGPESSQSTLYPYETTAFSITLDEVDAAQAGRISIGFEYQTPGR